MNGDAVPHRGKVAESYLAFVPSQILLTPNLPGARWAPKHCWQRTQTYRHTRRQMDRDREISLLVEASTCTVAAREACPRDKIRWSQSGPCSPVACTGDHGDVIMALLRGR